MSLLSDIGDGLSSAAKSVAHTVEDIGDIAGGVTKRMVDGTIDSFKHTFDDGFSVLKGIAFATVLSPLSLAFTAYNLGDAIYEETDKKLKEKNGGNNAEQTKTITEEGLRAEPK